MCLLGWRRKEERRDDDVMFLKPHEPKDLFIEIHLLNESSLERPLEILGSYTL